MTKKKDITFTELMEQNSDSVCPKSGEKDCGDCLDVDECNGLDMEDEDV